MPSKSLASYEQRQIIQEYPKMNVGHSRGNSAMVFRDLHEKNVAIEIAIGSVRMVVEGLASYCESEDGVPTLKIALLGEGQPVIVLNEFEWGGLITSGAEIGCDFLLLPNRRPEMLASNQTDSTMKSSISTDTP